MEENENAAIKNEASFLLSFFDATKLPAAKNLFLLPWSSLLSFAKFTKFKTDLLRHARSSKRDVAHFVIIFIVWHLCLFLFLISYVDASIASSAKRIIIG